VHVARHVDIDGIRQSDDATTNDQYSQSVDKARQLVRTLEVVTQSIYDDSSALLSTTQTLNDQSQGQDSSHGEQEEKYDLLDHLSSSLSTNLAQLQQLFEGLLSIGHEQADIAQGDYNGSIEWRMSRLSMINDHFGGSVHDQYRPSEAYDSGNEDLVDFADVVGRSTFRKQQQQQTALDSSYESYRAPSDAPERESQMSMDDTLVARSSVDLREDITNNDSELFEDDGIFFLH